MIQTEAVASHLIIEELYIEVQVRMAEAHVVVLIIIIPIEQSATTEENHELLV
jgi:hypothetical protein